MSMFKRISVFLLVVCALAGGRAYALENADPETNGSVPELQAFHEVIYPIWHEAYPAKNVEALRGFVPRINELSARIYKARLPGILRERSSDWKKGVSSLRKSVKAYNAAAKGSDAAVLLGAAEELHMRYEMLVRVIRPALPEMDAFHKVLYVVYHKDLPAGQWDAIRKKAAELSAGAAAVSGAVLPKRFEARSAQFGSAAGALVKAAAALQALDASAGGPEIKTAVLGIHREYEGLQEVLK